MTSSLSRRSALASLPVLGAAGVAVPATAAPGAPAPAGPHTGRRIRFAFIADSHADPENQESMAKLDAVMAAVASYDPTLVIHGGDVTEHGTEKEFDAFDAAVPSALRDRMVAVPGNHETRWDATAGERRQRRIGEEVHVRDADGVRVILADTTTHQQEVAWWSEQALADLDEAMQRSRSMPRILVTHFPMGEGYYYVANQQRFEDVLTRHPIPLHLTGHTHREKLALVNRRDQLEAAAVKIDAAYYELTGPIDEVEVTRVVIPDLTAPTTTERTPVTTFDLRPEHGTDSWRPRVADPVARRGSVTVSAKLPGSFHGEVDAAFYDTSVYAGRNDELAWTPLSGRGHRFTGTLDAAEIVPGSNRVHVRVRPIDGSGNRLLTVPFVLGKRGQAWRNTRGGMIQGGPALVHHRGEELLVIGDSSGGVAAIDARGRTRWTARVGGEIRHDLLAVGDGEAVAVPDTAGFLHLFGADGRRRWRRALGAPFAADPGHGKLDGDEVLFACAGTRLHAITAATGRRRWTAELPVPSMGAPASDGTRVFLGGGDGCAHALDGADGAELWTTSITDKSGSYQRFIYGPWNDAVTVLPDGGVVVSGISDTRCLEPEDGSERWRLKGSFQYAHEAVMDSGDLVLANEAGEIVRIDPGNGSEVARFATAERILDEGFVLVGEVVYAASHNGLITAVDLGTGDVEPLTRISTTPVLARGAAFGDRVVFSDLAGTVHAVDRL